MIPPRFRPGCRVAVCVALLSMAAPPLAAEPAVREDFSGYIGAGLEGMPVSPGTGLTGTLRVLEASRGLMVSEGDRMRYRYGPDAAHEVAGAAVRPGSSYQRPLLRLTVDRRPGGGPVTGGSVWVRFLQQFPVRNAGKQGAEPGLGWVVIPRPLWGVGVYNSQAGPGAVFRVGPDFQHGFQLPDDLAEPVCVLLRLVWAEGRYAQVEAWLNPRVGAGGTFAAAVAVPAQSLPAGTRLTALKELEFRWSPLQEARKERLPGLTAVGVAERLEDLMPGLPEPSGGATP